jgi:hypothetical protein
MFQIPHWSGSFSAHFAGTQTFPRRDSRSEARTGGVSQIDGFPMWVQGNSHPRCPKCDRWMFFVGQVATSEALGEPGEGVTYAFLCQDCKMAATAYEQT